MSRELEILAKEFQKKSVTVIRKDVNIYGTSIQSATSSLLRAVEQECKKQRQSHVTLIVVIPED